jgi:cysteine-S-conjugate beta-lyase
MSGHADRLRSAGGLKWTYFDEGVMAAWVAEMDFGLAPSIAVALHDAVDAGLTGYPFPEAETTTAMAAAGFWSRRFGWDVDPTWVAPAPDVIEGIRRSIVHLTRPGSPVVLHTPVYYPFFGMVERAGRDLVEVRSDVDPDGCYRLNLDGIDRALDDGAGSVILCNPWNPTGRVLTETELGDLVEIVSRHDARVIADEVHAPIVYSGASHLPVAKLAPERAITVTSASKAWNLPGLKCAQVVLTNESDRSVWNDYFTPEKVGVGTFGLIANTAAYTSGAGWLDDVLVTLTSNRDLVAGLVADMMPEAVLCTPQGTYLAWIDLGRYGRDDPTTFLLEHAGVAVTDGGPFGTGASRFVRFNFATHPDLVTSMIERMAAALTG